MVRSMFLRLNNIDVIFVRVTCAYVCILRLLCVARGLVTEHVVMHSHQCVGLTGKLILSIYCIRTRRCVSKGVYPSYANTSIYDLLYIPWRILLTLRERGDLSDKLVKETCWRFCILASCTLF